LSKNFIICFYQMDLLFSLLIQWNTLIGFQQSKQPYIPRINITWSWHDLLTFFQLYFAISFHEKYCPIVYFGWLWLVFTSGLRESHYISWSVLFSLCVRWYWSVCLFFFFSCLLKFINNVIWTWNFFCVGRALVINWSSKSLFILFLILNISFLRNLSIVSKWPIHWHTILHNILLLSSLHRVFRMLLSLFSYLHWF
jgi:hypothetical protein